MTTTAGPTSPPYTDFEWQEDAPPPQGYDQFCGPAVVASVLGISNVLAARALAAIEPPTGRGSTNIHTIAKLLGLEAVVAPERPLHEQNPRIWSHTKRVRYTVAQYLRRYTEQEAILLASAHFIHTRRGAIIEHNGSPKRRGRVIWVIDLTGKEAELAEARERVLDSN